MEAGRKKPTVGTGASLASFPVMVLAWALASGRLGPSQVLLHAPNVAAFILFAAALATAARLRLRNAGPGGRAVAERRASDMVFLGTSALVGSVIGCACAGRGLFAG